MVIDMVQNATVLQLPSDVHMRPCDTMAKRPLPSASYRRFKLFKIFASDFGNVVMQKPACTDTFPAMVNEGEVHSVYKVVTRSSFQCKMATHKVSGCKWMLHHSVTRLHTNLVWELKERGISLIAYNCELYHLQCE